MVHIPVADFSPNIDKPEDQKQGFSSCDRVEVQAGFWPDGRLRPPDCCSLQRLVCNPSLSTLLQVCNPTDQTVHTITSLHTSLQPQSEHTFSLHPTVHTITSLLVCHPPHHPTELHSLHFSKLWLLQQSYSELLQGVVSGQLPSQAMVDWIFSSLTDHQRPPQPHIFLPIYQNSMWEHRSTDEHTLLGGVGLALKTLFLFHVVFYWVGRVFPLPFHNVFVSHNSKCICQRHRNRQRQTERRNCFHFIWFASDWKCEGAAPS